MTIPVPYTHTDGRTLRLGKKSPRIDPRTFRLSSIMPRTTPPTSADWFGDVTSWGMMLNNVYGDCVCAMMGHSKQIASLNTPEGESTPSDNAVLNLYEKACGYVDGDPNTDNGCVILDTLNFVRQHGLGHKEVHGEHRHKPLLYAYAIPDAGDFNHIQEGIAMFGVCGIGLQLPLTAQAQVGGVWDVVGNPSTDPNSMPGSWGGHATAVASYSQSASTLTCATWGQLQVMTERFFSTYVDEAYVFLLYPWLDRKGFPASMNLALLEQQLAALDN